MTVITHAHRTVCPICKARHECASSVDDQQIRSPRRGDLTLCMTCGTVLIFATVHRLRPPTMYEQAHLPVGVIFKLRALSAAWQQMNERKKQ